MSDPTPRLVTAYGDRVRAALGGEEQPIVSYAGLWLLLAALAPVASGEDADRLAEVLGVPGEEAAARAGKLLAEPHPTVAAALGAWARTDLDVPDGLRLPVTPEPLPPQAELDRWAAEHTRGLIESFPVTVDARTLLVLATALVLEPRWRGPLREQDGLLLLRDGRQAVVDTEAAGPVAVAVPPTDDEVDVVSVIAGPDVPAADVWRATDEVAAMLDAGTLDSRARSARELADGHAWTVREERRHVQERDPDEVWTTRLPRWSADASIELDDAPGAREVVAALRAAMPRLEGEATCAQSATATYDEKGFSAAAVTALMVATSAPMTVDRTVRVVDVRFDRPHAVVAIARGGAWDGVPLCHAWVRPNRSRVT